ncbi:MAG: hypothetical protein JSV88_11465 [Candidatus Aminicenantes bacterium]|nr:MAG: hypothetical protein JSV88_11465 [Candidatus Aminicenantes bacterium]
MKFTLDDYIDEYIKKADENDKTVALHLKEIIEELKKEMDNGRDLKVAFHEVCEKYILKGDIIKAELPGLFTRIIVNNLSVFVRG